jgi:hypothetical protein
MTDERSVQLNVEQEIYVIEQDEGDFRVLRFDECLSLIERYSIELAGRGALPERFIDAPMRAERGTLAAYDTMRILEETLIAALGEGETAVAGLTPDLHGLEGHRVEVTTTSGDTRRFIVGLSSDPIPCHLEITDWTDTGKKPAEREYESVRDLGHTNPPPGG